MNRNGDNNYFNNDFGQEDQEEQNSRCHQPIPSQHSPIGAQNNKNNGFMLGLLAGVIIMTLVGSCAYVGSRLYQIIRDRDARATSANGEPAEGLINSTTVQKLAKLEELIDEQYYRDEDIDVNEMIEGMYAGVVDSLGDPYSTYYTAEEWQDIIAQNKGVYYGIGATIGMDTDTGFAKIHSVIADSPADKAGLRENDIIYMVEGELTYGLTTTEVVSQVRGKEGTTVHLTIYREGEPDYLEMDITRRHVIESTTVAHEMYDNGVGYIRITEFDDVTLDQFTEALAVIKGSDAKGLILDLRSNPGGSMPVVVDIARMILPKGLIVYTEDKYGNREEYSCNGENELNIPLVVLINGNSASASEILAGAVKDYKKGTLIGTTTYGKGIVQRVLPLTDGTAVKLTISSYFTPNGNNIHGVGIEPDIECELDADAYYYDGVDNQLERAKQEIEKMID